MSSSVETSDGQIIDLLRREPLSVSQIARATAVTATAVRQRLSRLMGQGLVEREIARTGRGRPSHRYALTAAARRQTGNNFADLAIVLWREIRGVKDPLVRRGLLERIAQALAASYADDVRGETLEARAAGLIELLGDRRVPFEVSTAGQLPVITANDCPYPGLAEVDRSVCAMERLLLAELLRSDVRLSHCRLDGHNCCQFDLGPAAASENTSLVTIP